MQTSEVKVFKDGDKLTVIIKAPNSKQMDLVHQLSEAGIDEVIGFVHKPDEDEQKAIDTSRSDNTHETPRPAAQVVPEQTMKPARKKYTLDEAKALAYDNARMASAGPEAVRDIFSSFLQDPFKKKLQDYWKQLRKDHEKDDPEAVGKSANMAVKLFREQYR